jgi:putative transposase
MERAAYPSDLTDEQWAVIQSVLPQAKNGRTGRPPKYDRREIWNAIFYQARTGCEWRYLPHDLPPWEDVWEHFSRWRDNGMLQQVHDALREKVRLQEGREPTPSAAIIDSQSVRTPQKGGTTASMRANSSKDASATSRWIRWVCSFVSSCTARESKTRTGPNSSS